jgi:hypothetical protein
MPKQIYTELLFSPDGPWLTLRDGEASVTINLRHWVREQMYATNTLNRRTMSGWLKARQAEDKEGKLVPPSVKVGVTRDPRPPIPASRRIPQPTAKRKSR